MMTVRGQTALARTACTSSATCCCPMIGSLEFGCSLWVPSGLMNDTAGKRPAATSRRNSLSSLRCFAFAAVPSAHFAK